MNLSLIKETDSFVKLFEDYNRAVCDCLVIDAFNIESESKMSTVISDLLAKLCHIQDGGNLEQLLMEPTHQIDHYLTCLKAMVLLGRNIGNPNENVFSTTRWH